jgi:hypothetical protein
MRRRQLVTLTLICSVLVSQAWEAVGAPSLQWTLPGTSITFADTGGTYVLVFSNKATATGSVSALADKGAGAQPSLWQFQCQISLGGTNVPGATVEYYITTSQDGTTVDGGVGTVSAALASADKRRNLTMLGVLVVDQTTANTTMVATFRNVYIPTRYFAVAWWNASGLTTETSTTKHKCVATPMPIQMQ